MSDVEEGFAELAGADWVWNLIQTFSFIHAQGRSECLGFTYAIAGYARCGYCDWEISATARGGDPARGRFGLGALAMVGATFDAIDRELVRRRAFA